MNEFTNFKNSEILSLHDLAPAVLAPNKAPSRSDRYTYVPTVGILDGLRQEGWIPVESRQSKVRDQGREGFQQHYVRLRREEHVRNLEAHDYVTDLVITNSHDGSCAYTMHAGIYRKICNNGLVVGERAIPAIRFAHRGLTPEKVVEASLEIAKEFPRLLDRIEEYKQKILNDLQQFEFAKYALALRYPENPPVSPEAILRPNRAEDLGTDLWRIMNRAQENLIRGGVSDGRRTPQGRLRSVRKLTGIRASVNVNKGLWDLAEVFFTA